MSLFVQLGIYIHNYDGTRDKKENVRIKNVPNAKIKIGNAVFMVSNSIHHHGRSRHEGHYTNMIRHQTTNWIRVSDLIVSPERWSNNAKNAYILFLE